MSTKVISNILFTAPNSSLLYLKGVGVAAVPSLGFWPGLADGVPVWGNGIGVATVGLVYLARSPLALVPVARDGALSADIVIAICL